MSLTGTPHIPQKISCQCALMTHAVENWVNCEMLAMNLEGENLIKFQDISGVQEHAVALLVEARRCKLEGRVFDSRRGHRDFSCDLIIRLRI